MFTVTRKHTQENTNTKHNLKTFKMSTSTFQKLEWSTMSEGYKGLLIEILKGYESDSVESEQYEKSAEIRDMINSPGLILKLDKHGEIENILPANEDVEKLLLDAGIKYQ